MDLLKEIGFEKCKHISTPIDPIIKLSNNEEVEEKDEKTYQRLVGRLIYLAYIGLDISYYVSVLSQFMHSLNQRHTKVAYRVKCILKVL